MHRIMTDMPIPETLSPWLVNSQGQATRHVYSYTQRETAEDAVGKLHPIYAFYYKCLATGEVRRWGDEGAEGGVAVDG